VKRLFCNHWAQAHATLAAIFLTAAVFLAPVRRAEAALWYCTDYTPPVCNGWCWIFSGASCVTQSVIIGWQIIVINGVETLAPIVQWQCQCVVMNPG
jgi:hypothetical protein